MNYFIYTYIISLLTGRYELNKLTSLPMCGFIAQLVEHRTGIAEVTGSNPVEALVFFRRLLSSCLNWKIHCEDHSSLCYVYNLPDVWRSLNPDLESFTWRNKSLTIQCRLDYFLVSQDVCRLTTSCKIVHAAETDHSEILIHFKNENANQRKGPGVWKFNK